MSTTETEVLDIAVDSTLSDKDRLDILREFIDTSDDMVRLCAKMAQDGKVAQIDQSDVLELKNMTASLKRITQGLPYAS